MKQLRFANGDGSLDITYLVDLIGTNDACTIYQVIQKVNNVNTPFGLNATAYQAGFNDKKEPTTLTVMKAFASDNNYTLTEYTEGAVPVVHHSLTALAVTTNALTAKVHGVLQKETATIVGTIEAAGGGGATVTVTAAGLPGNSVVKSVAVANNDTAAQVATKIRAALAADTDITALYSVGGLDADVVLTATVARANDATLNIAYANDTCAGLTPNATSNNTTAGAAGTLVNQTMVAVGGNTPYVWTTASALPPGVTFSTAGVLYGLPMAADTYPIVVRCTDRFGIYDESVSMDLVIS